MGSLSGSRSQNENQSTGSSSLWGGQSPFLEDLFGRGQGLADQFNPNNQMFDQAQAAWGQQIQPQGNPYLDQMAGQFQDQLGQLNQQTGGQAGLTGGFGGGRQGVAESLNTQNVGQQMGQFYGQQYQQDQNRALGALGMGGSVLGMSGQNQQLGNLGNLAGIIGGPIMQSEQQGTGSGSSKSTGVGIS